jgi:macrolide transport system ATP-binding/permease protein
MNAAIESYSEPAVSAVSEPLLQLRDLGRMYPAGDETIHALKGVNLEIRAGEMVAIVGQSGSGKSTLMNILGCLDRPTSGTYRVAGRETAQMEPDELAELRREHFGFIFQRYHLWRCLRSTPGSRGRTGTGARRPC